jgi:hypothetical protein
MLGATAVGFYDTFILPNFRRNTIFVEVLVYNLPSCKTSVERDILNTEKRNQLFFFTLERNILAFFCRAEDSVIQESFF